MLGKIRGKGCEFLEAQYLLFIHVYYYIFLGRDVAHFCFIYFLGHRVVHFFFLSIFFFGYVATYVFLMGYIF